MLSHLFEKNVEMNNMVTTTYSDPIDMKNAFIYSIQAVADVNTPAAKTLGTVDPDTDSVTITGHGLTTGLKGQLTTTGTLPAGLSTSTDYFIIVVDANTVAFATSLANALAGTKVNITDAGSGTHTFTSTAIAGGTVMIQKSNIGGTTDANWTEVAAATNITADATNWFTLDALKEIVNFRYMRIRYTMTAGRISAKNFVLVKGFEM